MQGKTEMLSQQYLEFGQKARDFYVKHGLMSKAADQWAKKMGTGWEKAPVQVSGRVSCVCVRVCECMRAQERARERGRERERERIRGVRAENTR